MIVCVVLYINPLILSVDYESRQIGNRKLNFVNKLFSVSALFDARRKLFNSKNKFLLNIWKGGGDACALVGAVWFTEIL